MASYQITSAGITARDAIVNDLAKAIDEINNAIAELQKCKGLGAELYITKLNDLIKTYTNIKSLIASVH